MTELLISDATREAFEGFVSGRPDVDRHEVFARCRREAPVFFSEGLGAWAVMRYDDVLQILKDEYGFGTLAKGAGAPVYGRSFIQWRGREHNKKAGIASRRIRSPRALASGLEDLVEDICARLAGELPTHPETVDLKAAYTAWVPLLVITRLLDVEEAAKFRDWYKAIALGGVSSIGHPERRRRAFRALAELREFLEPILAERRERPGDDLLSDVVTAEYDGRPLPDEEVVSMAAFLLTAGVETTERALASLLKHLMLHREQWDELRERRHDRAFLTSVAAEALRLFPPVQGVTRQALVDAELSGAQVRKGDKLLVLLASANSDEACFDDPDTFRPDRFIENPERQFLAGGAVLPFGAGRHHCAGSQLARLEMVHAMEKLLERVSRAEFAGEVPANEGFLLHSPPSVPAVLHAA